MRSHRLRIIALGLTLAAWVQPVAADPALRIQVDQRGDFLLIGNTLAHECLATGTPAVPAPVVGTVGNCPELNFTAPDVYFRADDPAVGSARADSNITALQARSTAVLNLPMGATVTHARLYWGAITDNTGPDRMVRIERPSAMLDAMVTADRELAVPTSTNAARSWYHAGGDVTAIVRAQGSGAYRISDVSSVPLASVSDPYAYVAWYMVVFYELPGEPQRNLALFDGLDLVEPGNDASVTLAGFLVPSSGFDAKLGIVVFEGDATITGDGMSFDGNALSDAQNPVDNFFNSTRTTFGVPVSVVGDLPQLTGAPRSMSGLDLDVFNVSTIVKPGQKMATINATTTLETYLLAAFVTSVSTLKPTFQTSSKALRDVNGGSIRPGDELEYTIEAINTGSDASANTVVRDVLPKGVTFVPGSIEIVSGNGVGKKSDAAGDDEAEYDPGMRTVRARLGMGATGAAGGSLALEEKSAFRFRVTIDSDARGLISNQGIVRAGGKKGAPEEDTSTDGDGSMPGSQTTDIDVNTCDLDSDCKPPTPLCDISSDPQTCAECITSADCKDPKAPDCSTKTHVCGCVLGAGKCNTDTDNDGISDDGETAIGTDPNDYDTDDDGAPDGAEYAPEIDNDGDGLDNAHDADSDNDGLFDGTELGFDCSNAATDKSLGRCRADADMGKTKTNPVRPDTDRAGVNDGAEDPNLDGAVQSGESDPSFGSGKDDVPSDADGDGLSDALERFLRSDPADADSDDDGASDGAEANPSEDTDLDGLLNVLDVDSDNDALYDGTELGRDCTGKGTDATKRHCLADSDAGKTKTSPLLRDTDGGKVSDGSEDANLNGLVDASETDPTATHAADDKNVQDTDKDGLSDPLESTAGTNPNDTDSDDDGLPDGEEPNPLDDHDGDGKRNALDPDSDDDGLFDGTELGKACSDAATDNTKHTCMPDADSGKTQTSALNPDSDWGGVRDGIEDMNKDGMLVPGELDPNDPSDDVIGKPCNEDADCGKMQSGLVCDMMKCAFGCRGMGGNMCPLGRFCSSTTSMVGMCTDTPPPAPDAGTPPVPDPGPKGRLQGGGCNCGVIAGRSAGMLPLGLGLTLLLCWVQRRRQRQS